MTRSNRAWDDLLSLGGESARSQVDSNATPRTPEAEDGGDRTFDQLLQAVPAYVRQQTNRIAEPARYDWPSDARPRYCGIECENGEFPVLRMFESFQDLVHHMDQLEGQDTCFWPFYGMPLPFSAGNPRLIFLPDGRAFSIEEKPQEHVASIENVTIQSDGHMGEPDLGVISRREDESEQSREVQDQEEAGDQSHDLAEQVIESD